MLAHLGILPFPSLLNFLCEKSVFAHGCVGEVPLWRIMFNFVRFQRLPSL